jgi:dihydroneopterin aldolase
MDSMAIYIAAAAIFIATIAVIFFYREIQNIKRETSVLKTIKNQISNMDSRFDCIEDTISKYTNIPEFIDEYITKSKDKSIEQVTTPVVESISSEVKKDVDSVIEIPKVQLPIEETAVPQENTVDEHESTTIIEEDISSDSESSITADVIELPVFKTRRRSKK